MRTSSCLALLCVPCAMLACTALLGDFTVGPGDGGDSGGDVNPGDAANDAATLYQLSCAEGSKSSRVQVTMGDSLNADLIRVAALPAMSSLRTVLANYVSNDAGSGTALTLESYTVPGQTPIVPASLVTTGSQAFAIERYNDADSGFAVLYIQFDMMKGQNFLCVARISDSASTWSPPVELVPVGTSTSGNLEADFTVINSATDDYFIAYSTVDAMNQTIFGGEAKFGSGNMLPSIAVFPAPSPQHNAFDLTRPGVAYRAGTGYVMLSPSGNNGPPPVGSPAMLAQSVGSPIMLTPGPNLNYFPAGFVNAVDPMKVNAAFLTANLNTLTGQYGVGQVAVSSLATFDPSTLPPTIPTGADGGAAGLKDLFVGGSSPTTHWERPPLNTEQFIIVQPTIIPGNMPTYVGGVNFAWWDALTGTLRTYATGDGNLLSDIPFINNADATITGLVGSIAQVTIAYENASANPNMGSNNGPVSSDLWLTNLSCFKKP